MDQGRLDNQSNLQEHATFAVAHDADERAISSRNNRFADSNLKEEDMNKRSHSLQPSVTKH